MILPETASDVEKYLTKHGPLLHRGRLARMGGAEYDAARRAAKERARISVEKRDKRTIGEEMNARRR